MAKKPNHYTEILDIVSPQDEIIGTMPRHEVHAKKIRNFRAVNAFLINDKGKIWIPRRHPDKILFPLCLDMSIGGHVSSGETYEQAFLKEAQEEVNLHLTPKDFSTLARMTPYTHGTSAFMYVYGIGSNTTPNFNKQDFIESFWLHPQEVLELIANGEQTKGDLPIIVSALQETIARYKPATFL